MSMVYDGQGLIAAELGVLRSQLKDRQTQLVKQERNLVETKAACERLVEKIEGLERDQQALRRGLGLGK